LSALATPSGSSLAVVLQEHAAVGADRQRGAQRLLGSGRADRDHDDLGGGAVLLEAHRFLDGNLVERVDGHLDVREVDAGAVGLHADLDVGVHDALYGNQNFHVCCLSGGVVTVSAARGSRFASR
jgi:hypothetical protein